MKEIYTSNHMWSLFEKSFIVDMSLIASSTHDRHHADTALETYVTGCLMNIISTFFSSPFSDQSTTVQVTSSFIALLKKNITNYLQWYISIHIYTYTHSYISFLLIN